MAPGVKAKVMYCTTGQISQKNTKMDNIPWRGAAMWYLHVTQPLKTSHMEFPIGHLLIGHLLNHRRPTGIWLWVMAGIIISGFQKSDLQVSTTVKGFVSN